MKRLILPLIILLLIGSVIALILYNDFPYKNVKTSEQWALYYAEIEHNQNHIYDVVAYNLTEYKIKEEYNQIFLEARGVGAHHYTRYYVVEVLDEYGNTYEYGVLMILKRSLIIGRYGVEYYKVDEVN